MFFQQFTDENLILNNLHNGMVMIVRFLNFQKVVKI